MVKCNLPYSCLEFYKFLKTRKIGEKDKYNPKTRSGKIIVIEDLEFSHDDGDDEFATDINSLLLKNLMAKSSCFLKNGIPRKVQFLDIHPVFDPQKDAILRHEASCKKYEI